MVMAEAGQGGREAAEKDAETGRPDSADNLVRSDRKEMGMVARELHRPGEKPLASVPGQRGGPGSGTVGGGNHLNNYRRLLSRNCQPCILPVTGFSWPA